ncbi:8-amino-7-oxononanoate synthase [Pectinatus sottacetonis]|uniref:8-amino-7-oxononanoate synthase n=1 Tax=Pectinatus sottacetonis TaxID=1002795 RepID=UPI0018C5AB49|nr:8-amino-7-oxononanoate synthase [Pectinatus sottacetonis]
MALYSLKMRASKKINNGNMHISGAEKIIAEEKINKDASSLLQRALHHAKGKPDFINLKVESVNPRKIEHIKALPVTSIEVKDADMGQRQILALLEKLHIKNGLEIMKKFKDTYAMRGAMLLDADTLERLEPDPQRGIRATYMDAEDSGCPADKDHYKEAIVLASKVVNSPYIVAEICMSDDPDYVTGYVAAKDIGYVRITKLKEMGCPDGGRIFLFRGKKENIPDCINYLEKQYVLVGNIPQLKSDNKENIRQNNFIQKISIDIDTLQKQHLYRTMYEISSAQNNHIKCENKDMIMLASNNYLGLINNPQIKATAVKAIHDFGTGSGGSRLTTGNMTLHVQWENELAEFKNTEAALTYNTGYMANVGIISALCDKNTIIFSDELNHASIIDGCRLSKARTIVYRHNDMKDLERKICLYSPCRALIVSDAVFSMDGDIANMPGIIYLAKKYHFLSMLDEAHSTGVIGKTGRGIVEYYNSSDKPDILMGTMSKALASEGGFVCGSQILIDYLRNKSRSFIFSTSLSPAVIAAALKALELIEKNPSIVQQLQKNTAYFSHCLAQNGIPVNTSSAIVPIKTGGEKCTMEIAEKLFAVGIYISAIRYPTVKKGEARLRAAIMATHNNEDLSFAADKIAEIIKKYK